MTDNDILAIGYRKLTADDMKTYVLEHGTKEQIAKYANTAYAYVKKVKVINPETGLYEYTEAGRISKKNGKAITPRVKTEVVVITDVSEIAKLEKAGKKRTFLAFQAKQCFCDMFFPQLLPKKQENKKEPPKTASMYDALMDALK